MAIVAASGISGSYDPIPWIGAAILLGAIGWFVFPPLPVETAARLQAEFLPPPIDRFTHHAARLLPFVAVGFATALVPGEGEPAWIALFLLPGLIAVRQPANWRIVSRMVGAVSLIVGALV
jgi:hypothetical protein